MSCKNSNENKDLQSSSAQGASSAQIIHSDAMPCASVSNDLISVIDDEYYLDSYYLTEGMIGDSLKIENGMVPRGRYWLGAAATNIKTDREILQSEFLQNQQVFFTTDTVSVGLSLQLNSAWSQIIEDISTAARTRALTHGETSGLQHEKNEQRSSTPCDQTKYWRAIHVQYKGHIPFEFALKTLMEANYDFCEALDSIEKCLLVRPQRMKPIGHGQARLLAQLLKNEKTLRLRSIYELDPRRMMQMNEVSDFIVLETLEVRDQIRSRIGRTGQRH